MSRSSFVFSLLCLSFILAGCGGSASEDFVSGQSSGAGNPNQVVFVDLSEPARAQVEVRAETGALLGQAEVFGMGSVELPSIPATAIVSATFDDPFSEKAAVFLAEVQGIQPNGVVGIDPVSTLIAMRHQQHPEESFQQAAERVFAFLGLSLETAPNQFRSASAFDEEAFRAQAEADGGHANFFVTLLGEMETSSGSPRNLGGEKPSDLFTTTGIATEIAKGALSYVGGEAIGWIAGKIGLGGADPNSQVLKTLAAVQAQIEALGDLVKTLANIQLYATKDAQLVEQRAKVEDWLHDLTVDADPANTAPPSIQAVKDNLHQIEIALTGVLTKVESLEEDDVNGGAGLTRIFIEHVTKNKLWVDKFYDQYSAHFRLSQQFQAGATTLLHEAYHQADTPQFVKAEELADQLLVNLKKQRNLYPLPYLPEKPTTEFEPYHILDEWLLTDPRAGLVWSRHVVTGWYPDVATEIRGYSFYGDAPAGAYKIATLAQINSLLETLGNPSNPQDALEAEGFVKSPADSKFGENSWLKGDRWKNRVITSDETTYPGKVYVKYFHLQNKQTGSTEFYEPVDGKKEKVIGAYLLCRPVQTVKSLKVEPVQRPGALPFERDFRAIATLSDGAVRDVTPLVVWSVNVDNLHAHISNAPETSGRLTLRAPASGTVQVKASFRAVSSDPVTVPTWDKFVLRSTFLWTTPRRAAITTYPGTITLTATRTTNNGQVFNSNTGVGAYGLGQVTWSSSDPSVTVDESGVVNVATGPSIAKTVTITAVIAGNPRSSTVISLAKKP